MYSVCILNGPIGVKESGVQDSSTIIYDREDSESPTRNAKPHQECQAYSITSVPLRSYYLHLMRTRR